LHLAAFQGDLELVRYFLRCGANQDLTNTSGYTPLTLAEYKGETEIAGLLRGDAAEVVQLVSSSSS